MDVQDVPVGQKVVQVVLLYAGAAATLVVDLAELVATLQSASVCSRRMAAGLMAAVEHPTVGLVDHWLVLAGMLVDECPEAAAQNSG